MTNEQTRQLIQVKKAMIGEYVSRMNPLAGDADPLNSLLMRLHDDCLNSIERLEKTLAVRAEAGVLRAAS